MTDHTASPLKPSDLEFAAFIGRSEAAPWLSSVERFKPTTEVLSTREYDRITDYNLAFIRGQQVAGRITEGEKAWPERPSSLSLAI